MLSANAQDGESASSETEAPPQWGLGRTVESTGQALPPRFPYIKDELSGEICEVTLLFMADKYLTNKRSFNPRTVGAYTGDLLDWMRFGSEFHIPWDKATWADLDNYMDTMDEYSPHHGKVLSAGTQSRRLVPIKRMYGWAAEEFPHLCIDAPLGTLLKPRNVAHFLDDRRKDARNRMDVRDDEPSAPNVMKPDEVKAVLKLVGAPPLSMDAAGQEAVQAAETSIGHLGMCMGQQVGLRVSEVAGMPLKLFLRFMHISIVPSQTYEVGPFRRKGGKLKSVDFHGVLLQKVVNYIGGERKLAMRGKRVDHGRLLVHKEGRFQGHPTTTSTLQRRFTRACVGANLLRGAQRVRAVNGDWSKVETVYEQRSAFTFHDLRHTFAVWMYYAKKRNGDPEPWKYIQEQLGHESLETTLKTYLKVTRDRDFRAFVSDKYVRTLNVVAGIAADEVEAI